VADCPPPWPPIADHRLGPECGIHACSPAGIVVEEIAGAWLREFFRLPVESSFPSHRRADGACYLPCGGTSCATHRRGWDVGRKGLNGAPTIRIMATADRHGSVDRAVRLLGFGTIASNHWLSMTKAGTAKA